MTSHNPLRPKSSLLEQKAKSRSGLQMVMIIVAVHVVFLGGLLFSGCRPEKPAPEPAPGPDAIPVLPPDGGGVASPQAEINTVTVLEAPSAPPLPDATTSEPKPPPVTRDTEPVEDIVPLIPEPSEGPEVPVAAGEIEYVVAKGDNFTNIASRHGVTVQAIIHGQPGGGFEPHSNWPGADYPLANGQDAPGPSLPEGTVVYEVKPGDSLYAIAKEHKITVKAIRKANDLSTSKIRPGQKLTIHSPETEN